MQITPFIEFRKYYKVRYWITEDKIVSFQHSSCLW